MVNERAFPEVNFCVLIPTYNNDQTLGQVISKVLEYTTNVIVINDGSSDHTGKILERFQNKIEIISLRINQGKGAALKSGLKKAEKLGYEYAITIDSDGQHFAEDIPKFLEKVQPGQDILIIGDRNMTGADVPPKSLFGKKFSNFWVKLETGRDLMDTQSGYRLYTVAKMNRFRFVTKRYDFELESLVRWVWRGFPVAVVGINVHYPPQGERVSHFKGFKDNFRISLLNTVLVMIAFGYIIPKRILGKFSKIIISLSKGRK